jgi:hypothetical protein
MQYLVSIENCQFFRWQVELLYESMRPFGLSDSLVIACANFESKPLRFGNVFYHENVGRKFNYLPLNKPYAIQTALVKKIIKQPFVVLDPDMVMLNPMSINSKCSANYSNYLEYDNLVRIGYQLNFNKDEWRPGAYVYQFNECKQDYIEEIYEDTLRLTNKNDLPSSTDFWQREMVSFGIFLSKVNAFVSNNYMSSLYEESNNRSNFIHYSNGFQPHFNKNIHNNLREFSFGPSLPFESILKIPSFNSNIVSFKNIVKSFLSKNLNNEI